MRCEMSFFFENPEEAARFRWGMAPTQPAAQSAPPTAEPSPIDAEPIERKEAQIEDAAAQIEEMLPTQPTAPASPAPVMVATDPASGAVTNGQPLTFTELVTKYAERFGTVALHQALKKSGARRVRDLDPSGQAGLAAFITGELAKPVTP